MYDNGDILLFALSAWRQTSWRNFKQCFNVVQRKSAANSHYDANENASGHRWRALRELSALGHVDLRFEKDDIQVVTAPPALAVLPGFESRTAVLCGARSPGLISRLEYLAGNAGIEMTVDSQSNVSPYAPARIELHWEDQARIRSAADSVGVRFLDIPPARQLARVSISLAEYRHNLAWSRESEINWRREDFDTEALRFRTPGAALSEQRLSRYQNPVTSLWQYRLRRGDLSAEVDLDWGRYIILAVSAKHTMRYRAEHRTAFVPYGAPLPALLARSFGLCSGQCPAISEEVQVASAGRHHEFKGVPPSIFSAVAGKLEQTTRRNR